MNDDYYSGMTLGCAISLIALTMIFLLFREVGREECEQDLPRTQQCELKWVKPESAKK